MEFRTSCYSLCILIIYLFIICSTKLIHGVLLFWSDGVNDCLLVRWWGIFSWVNGIRNFLFLPWYITDFVSALHPPVCAICAISCEYRTLQLQTNQMLVTKHDLTDRLFIIWNLKFYMFMKTIIQIYQTKFPSPISSSIQNIYPSSVCIPHISASVILSSVTQLSILDNVW